MCLFVRDYELLSCSFPLPQAQRENVIKKFRMGEIWILVATDLLGRGMDFKVCGG